MKSKTPREIAERLTNDWHLRGGALSQLAGAIEIALNNERERCAVIAETDDFTHSSGYRCYRGEVIAAAIRGSKD